MGKHTVSAFLVLVVAVFMLGGVSTSEAGKMPPPPPTSCAFGSTVYTPGNPGADLTTSTACEFYLGANDKTSFVDAVDPFGITDWKLAEKSDEVGAGDGAIDLQGVVNGTNTGTWSVDSFNGYTSVFLTLKAGDGFAAYLLDTAFLSGAWTTGQIFPSGGGGKGLSHMSLYYSPSSLTTVPLPAALPLYAAGIAILGFFGWRKRKA